MSKDDDKSPFFEIIGGPNQDTPAQDEKTPAKTEPSPVESTAPTPSEEDNASAPDPPKPTGSPFFEFIGGAAPAQETARGSAKDKGDDPPQDKPRKPVEPPRQNAQGLAILEGLSSRAYEHPADRAAMSALRKVPGLDLLLRKMVGLIGERSLRYLYLASAVRVSENQYPSVYKAHLEVSEVLGFAVPPELYVAQTPLVNAGAIGVDEPFIVLNSGTVQMLSIDELKVVIGHELGHILSDHVLYKTMLRLLLGISLASIGIPLGNIALFGIVTALREWDRKSELSCDRAGLLAVQDPRLVFSVHMKLAGGGDSKDMSVDAFIQQAEEYERAGGSVTDGIFKLLNLLGRTHPFHVTRLAELKKWSDGEVYPAILQGHYPKRENDEKTSVYSEVKDGAAAYRESYEKSEDPLMRFLGDVGTTVSDAASSAWSSTRNFFGGLVGGNKDDKGDTKKD